MVIIVIFFRKRKFKSTHIFIVALAISDTLFSVAIHPMLIATSFGVSPHELFGVSGKIVCLICSIPSSKEITGVPYGVRPARPARPRSYPDFEK